MLRYQTTEAIVLNHHRFHESDQTVTLLTPRLGKLITTAKGSKSVHSRRLGDLELGNIVKAQLYQKGDRYWLTDVTVTQHILSSTKNLTQLNLVFYFLEVINSLVAENQIIDHIFRITKSLISSIEDNNFTQLIKSEIELLQNLGFGVPENIIISKTRGDLVLCQREIKMFLESIIEKPIRSSKLFR